MTCFRGSVWSAFVSAVILMGTLFLSIEVGAAENATSLGGEMATLASGAFNTDGGSFRHDFCSHYEQFTQENTKQSYLRHALSGLELSVFVSPLDYFRYNETSGIDSDYPGLNAVLLDYMAERGNFTWRKSFGVFSPDELGNRSYTEFLQWGVDKYDVVLGIFTPTTERMDLGIGFVEGHYDGSLVMARNVKPENPPINWINFLRPFEVGVWLVIIAVVIFSAVVYQFLEHMGACIETEKSLRKRVTESMYNSCINFTGNYTYEPTTLSGMVFGFFFAFWAMLMTASYTANLSSILVVTSLPAPKIHDLQDAIDQRLPICIIQGAYEETYIKEKYPGSVSYLVPIPDQDSGYNALNEGKCELLVAYQQALQSKSIQEKYNPNCLLEQQGRTIQTLQSSFATKIDPAIKCTALVTDVMSYFMKEMKENGDFDKFWKQHNEFYGTPDLCDSKAPTRNPNDTSLTLKDMAGTMLWQVVGSLLAIVIALLSGLDRKTKKKRIERRESTTSRISYDDTSSSSLQKQLDEISHKLEGLNNFSRQLGDLNETVSELQDALSTAKNGVP